MVMEVNCCLPVNVFLLLSVLHTRLIAAGRDDSECCDGGEKCQLNIIVPGFILMLLQHFAKKKLLKEK
jgi:hypothetical protein